MRSRSFRTALLCAIISLAAVLFCASAGAAGLNTQYRTREQIAQYLEQHPTGDKQTEYSAVPSVNKLDAGSLSTESINDTLNAVNRLRYIAGLDEVTADSSYMSGSQTLALIMAANGAPTYYPKQPSSMSNEVFAQGNSLVLGCNISRGYPTVGNALTTWIADSDSTSRERCVHRRRILSPTLGTVGFGQVDDYSVMYVLDSSALKKSTVAWPAQNTPCCCFSGSEPWSLSIGENLTSAAVTVTDEKGGMQWSFSGTADKGAVGDCGYFSLTNSTHSQPGCVVFLPNDIDCSAGQSYLVSVSGTLSNGSVQSYEYRVAFFDAAAQSDPFPTDEPYSKPQEPDADADFERIAGSSRINTAIEISKKGWESADTVVIANGFVFADALAGVPLAAAADAPILLTAGNQLESAVSSEIARLGATKVYLLGGESVIGNSLITELTDNNLTVRRISGKSRYATAVEIAEELKRVNGSFKEVFLASADSFPDALAISPIAAIKGSPVLYISKTGVIDEGTAELIRSTKCSRAIILGGVNSVSEAGEQSVAALGISTSRVSGSNRYATALSICQQYDTLFTGNGSAIATGESFPDALAGGAYAAKQHVPMVLIHGKANEELRTYIAARSCETRHIIFGGQNSVSEDTLNSLRFLG